MSPSQFAGVHSEKELMFFAFLALFSLGFARLVSWLFRRGEHGEPQLATVQQAYLIAGPVRAIEISLFVLARDSWVKHDGRGFFHSRFGDAPEQLDPLERELLQAIIQRNGMKVVDMSRLRLANLDTIDKSLVRNGLLLSDADFQLSSLLCALPFFLTLGLGCIRLYQEGVVANGFNGFLALELIVIAVVMFKVRQGFSRRTDLGETVELNLINDIKTRSKIKLESRFSNDLPQDLLWSIKDDILSRGLQSLAGTVFAPLSSFAGAETDEKLSTVPPESYASHTSEDGIRSKYGSEEVFPERKEETAVYLSQEDTDGGASVKRAKKGTANLSEGETQSAPSAEVFDLGQGFDTYGGQAEPVVDKVLDSEQGTDDQIKKKDRK